MITFQKGKPYIELTSEELIKKNKVTRIFSALFLAIALCLMLASIDIQHIIIYFASFIFALLSIIWIIIYFSEKVMILIKNEFEKIWDKEDQETDQIPPAPEPEPQPELQPELEVEEEVKPKKKKKKRSTFKINLGNRKNKITIDDEEDEPVEEGFAHKTYHNDFRKLKEVKR